MPAAGAVAARTFAGALLFVAGFSVVFVSLGAGPGPAVGELLRAHLEVLSIVAGLAIVVMGLNFLGVFRIHCCRARRARKWCRQRAFGAPS